MLQCCAFLAFLACRGPTWSLLTPPRSFLRSAGSAWVQDLKRTTTEVGGTDETKAFASQIFAGLAKLEKSAGQGNLKGAKADYVEAVEALETWAVLAGFSSSVQGL